MALVAKRNHQQGQISIFFSASLVVFVSIIAFVINVGLFVKAKINLQNATDAAAWSGAAVQARQLTKIAYLNWEMRNVYKEWLYKYYVIGSLNTPGVEDPDKKIACSGGNCTDFRLAPDVNAISGATVRDDYNFPAVCIHIAGSKTNICRRFAVPGLPEFGSYSIPGNEEASRSFIDGLIGSKVDDCVTRSQLNMLVTTTWAYNVIPVNGAANTLAGRGPAIMNDRQGAWPKAIEIAMRIRNLEKVMNRPTVEKAVCIGGIGSCDPIDNYSSEPIMGNERIVKAFYSGYRNLGNHIDSEMKDSFMLTELPPRKPEVASQWSASSLLIPEPYEKQYVDLKLMMVNLATFYAALIPRADTATSGACDISKVAIPVPGYPLGFYKNPNILTYYAVKGEAEFAGMFNPFADDAIKLTAYAAAKPMGGRIGPMLFKQAKTEQAIYPRTDDNKYRSVPYLSSLNVEGTYNKYLGGTVDPGEFGPGVPLPVNLSSSLPFWLINEDDPVGGLATDSKVQFGIPNLVYDFTDGSMSPDSYTSNGERLFTIEPKNLDDAVKPIGLFNHDQFTKFRGDLGGEVSQEVLAAHISRVRAPTLYEAANYLIPTPNKVNKELGIDSFGSIAGEGASVPEISGLTRYTADIYAPLHRENANHNDILYLNADDVLTNIISFMRAQKSAMDNYTSSLNQAAVQTYRTAVQNGSAAAVGAQALYKAAAERISDIGISDVMLNPGYMDHIGALPKTCDSLAGQFWHFYYGDSRFGTPLANPDPATCPVPLAKLLQEFFSNPDASPARYRMEYNLYEGTMPDKKRLFSAYAPGPYNGVNLEAQLVPPSGFPNQQELMRRNFYSTKLVTLDAIQKSRNYDETSNFAIYSEGDISSSGSTPDRRQSEFENYLEADTIAPDLDSIKY